MPTTITPRDVETIRQLRDVMDPPPKAASAPPILDGAVPWLIAGVVVWVLGIVVSDRAADELFMDLRIGRLIGILLPIIGPLILVLMVLRQRQIHYLE